MRYFTPMAVGQELVDDVVLLTAFVVVVILDVDILVGVVEVVATPGMHWTRRCQNSILLTR
jgi:hypothetical protein